MIKLTGKTDKKRMNINIFMFKYNKKSVIIITRCWYQMVF